MVYLKFIYFLLSSSERFLSSSLEAGSPRLSAITCVCEYSSYVFEKGSERSERCLQVQGWLHDVLVRLHRPSLLQPHSCLVQASP